MTTPFPRSAGGVVASGVGLGVGVGIRGGGAGFFGAVEGVRVGVVGAAVGAVVPEGSGVSLVGDGASLVGLDGDVLLGAADPALVCAVFCPNVTPPQPPSRRAAATAPARAAEVVRARFMVSPSVAGCPAHERRACSHGDARGGRQVVCDTDWVADRDQNEAGHSGAAALPPRTTAPS